MEVSSAEKKQAHREPWALPLSSRVETVEMIRRRTSGQAFLLMAINSCQGARVSVWLHCVAESACEVWPASGLSLSCKQRCLASHTHVYTWKRPACYRKGVCIGVYAVLEYTVMTLCATSSHPEKYGCSAGCDSLSLHWIQLSASSALVPHPPCTGSSA
eukprot:362753-Chlamydomonas_euryale.AAC.1